MDATESKPIISCVSCGETVSGKYCGHCGEKVLHPHDKSIGHFFHEFLHGLTHADGKFLKSLKYLFSRPGFLSAEHIAGRRKLYTSPLSLFLIANLLYLLIPATDALNSHYQAQTLGQPYSWLTKPIAAEKMQEQNWTPQQMEERYNTKTDKISKILLILLVLLFSVPVSLLFYNKRMYYADHLTFATEALNFLILGLLWLLPWFLYLVVLTIWKLFHVNLSSSYNNIIGTYVVLSLVLVHLYLAAKRVYRQHWFFTAGKALMLTFSLVLCVVAYRFILFWVVMGML